MDKNKTFFVFLTGIAVGASAGFLFAPHRGAKTRRKLAKRIKKATGVLTSKVKSADALLHDSYESAKNNLSSVLD
jgi:gas vesicle protein